MDNEFEEHVKAGRGCAILKVLPVLSGFFVMGFCDIAGIATSYIKQDFRLSETVAGFVPSMIFIWFLLLSVPVAMIMDRFGRKKIVQVSNVLTIVGMLLPFIHYDIATCMSGLVLLGIGNTMLQVSLNPLLSNVVPARSLTSVLTVGQVVKAVSSFCGPFIAAFTMDVFGKWQYLFPVFAAITLLSSLWLMFTSTPQDPPSGRTPSLTHTFSLLGDREILMFFFGIFFIVGLDVGLNTVAPKLLIERAGFDVSKAGFGSSVYFVCRTAGALLAATVLARMDPVRWFRINISLAVVSLMALFFAKNAFLIFMLVGLAGFFSSSVFSIIYSLAMQRRPDRANGVSGLMIMGVSGGAVIPPLMGFMSDLMGSQAGSVAVILCCAVYLWACAFKRNLRPEV